MYLPYVFHSRRILSRAYNVISFLLNKSILMSYSSARRYTLLATDQHLFLLLSGKMLDGMKLCSRSVYISHITEIVLPILEVYSFKINAQTFKMLLRW